MSKYIKLFDTHAEYLAFTQTSDFIKPNVSHCIDNNDVHYNPWTDPRLIVKYTVEVPSNPTQLYTYLSQEGVTVDGATMFDKVEIDGTEVSISDLDSASGQYQLSEGEHTARYTLKDPTLIGLEIIDESTQQMNVGAMFFQCSAISEVKIPNTVTTIGESAFGSCTGLTSVTIPNSVTTVGDSAFYECTSLTSVTIPDSVTSIGSAAFYGCTSLTSVTIPNSVTTIDISTFNGCTSLTSVTIPNSVTSIGNGAFYGCSGLTSVTIGNSVTTIDITAFSRCTGLTSVAIPNSVTSIGNAAFQHCSGLTSVTIGNSVTTISTYTFDGCTGLTSVTVQATTPPTLNNVNAFNSTNNCPIYVPSASVEAYKAATNWSSLSSRIQAIP